MTTAIDTESYRQHRREWRRKAGNVAAEAGLSLLGLARALNVLDQLQDLGTDTALVEELIRQYKVRRPEE